jgi:hypothetical protein
MKFYHHIEKARIASFNCWQADTGYLISFYILYYGASAPFLRYGER